MKLPNLINRSRQPILYFLVTNAVDGGDLHWVRIGAFVMGEGSDDYVFDNRSGNMLNASWPSKLCIRHSFSKCFI